MLKFNKIVLLILYILDAIKMKIKYKKIKGIISIGKNRKGYVYCEEIKSEVVINKRNLNKAFDGDEVIIYIYNKINFKNKYEGEVLEIIKRKKNKFKGIVQINKNFGFVKSIDKRNHIDFYIDKKQIKKYKEDEIVLVELINWPKDSKKPNGKITKSFGKIGNFDTEINTILNEFELSEKFNKKIIKEAEKINTKIEKKEIKKRRDFRDILTFTIDPEDAKDFDDAISVKHLYENEYEIGIHIADVTHYVKEMSIIDNEAKNRATSVYLVDRVITMLPEKISNYICSLRPNEEKFTFSAVFKIDLEGEVKESWFGKSIIKSKRRFTYKEVEKILNKENKIKGIEKALEKVNKIAKKLRRKRNENGSINFEKKEVKFILNEKKEPKKIKFKESNQATKLIEELMLLANKKVAEYIYKKIKNKKTVYRIHDFPDQEKIKELKEVCKNFGHKLETKGKGLAKSLNKILKNIKGKQEQNMIDNLAIRAMSKAEYSTKNIGHYGLSFSKYTHFTSPIRRYPDMMVHRILNKLLQNKKGSLENDIDQCCIQSTKQEINATKAERESIKYMQVKYMEDKIGQVFKGIISGINERNIYVEINENKCEGMIRVNEMRDDKYYYNEKKRCLVGKRKGTEFFLGDNLYVQVVKVDVVNRYLDFIVSE